MCPIRGLERRFQHPDPAHRVVLLRRTAAGFAAVHEWAAAGPRGINDPDLHGLGAVISAVITLVTGVVTLLFVVALVQQRCPSSRTAGTRLAAVVHVPVVLCSIRWLVSPPPRPNERVSRPGVRIPGVITALRTPDVRTPECPPAPPVAVGPPYHPTRPVVGLVSAASAGVVAVATPVASWPVHEARAARARQ